MFSINIDELSDPEVGISDVNMIASAEVGPWTAESRFNEVNSGSSRETLPLSGNLTSSSFGVILGENSLAIWLASGIKTKLIPFVEDLGEILIIWAELFLELNGLDVFV